MTTLLGKVLEASGRKVFVCGNIGTPFTDIALKTTEDSITALEVSSFQLETIDKFRPHVSIILNITQDHLDRYNSMDDYAWAKARSFINQTSEDYLIVNYDDEFIRKISKKSKAKVIYFSSLKEIEGIFFRGSAIYLNMTGGASREFLRVELLKLKGVHNIENCMAVIAAAMVSGIREDDIIKELKNFETLEHRIEYVDTINGIKFINDSKSTNVDGTKRALEMFDEPVILIAGGLDKNSDFTSLREVVGKKVKEVFLIGQAKDKIDKAFKGIVPTSFSDTLFDAVFGAFKKAKSGDSILLSPICASFDMFDDYKHRGKVFKEAVQALKDKA